MKPVSAEMQTAMQEVPQQPEFELFGTSGAFSPEKVTVEEPKKTSGKSAGAAKARTQAVLEADRESTSKGQEIAGKGTVENAGKGAAEETVEMCIRDRHRNSSWI